MVHGPLPALAHLAAAEADPALADHHRVHAVRAHLLDLAGDHDSAKEHYLRAARTTLNQPEQRYLEGKARSITDP
jgi:predicted RNA polymerase sigma factor